MSNIKRMILGNVLRDEAAAARRSAVPVFVIARGVRRAVLRGPHAVLLHTPPRPAAATHLVWSLVISLFVLCYSSAIRWLMPWCGAKLSVSVR